MESARCAIGVLVALLVFAPTRAQSQDPVRKLAEIPEGMRIAVHELPTSSYFKYSLGGGSMLMRFTQRERSTPTWSRDGMQVAYAGALVHDPHFR